jgi:hypothetical protein
LIIGFFPDSWFNVGISAADETVSPDIIERQRFDPPVASTISGNKTLINIHDSSFPT